MRQLPQLSDLPQPAIGQRQREIAFDVSKWSYQMGLVTLELDTPIADDASPLFDFDESGRAVFA